LAEIWTETGLKRLRNRKYSFLPVFRPIYRVIKKIYLFGKVNKVLTRKDYVECDE
jgi:hypothetical protein